MKKLTKQLLLAGAMLLSCHAATAQQLTIGGAGWGSLPYQNPQLSAEQRAEDLISRLTLEEKAKLMLDQSEAIPRLGIPKFQWWNEALHGVGRNGFTTVFPITMAMAASWNDALLYKVFDAVSDEARVKYYQAKRTGDIKRYQGLSFWTPNVNIFRDPRWGRGQETYGEDPYLTERMGLAAVDGLQGAPHQLPRGGESLNGNGSLNNFGNSESLPSGRFGGGYKLLACAKHYAVHSGPEWNRHSFNIENLPERDLWETYLPAFKSLVQKGNVAEVMCAYQAIDGEPCCGQTRYLQQILRNEWGFKGIVVSDCGAIRDFHQKGCHEVTKNAQESAAKAVLAGTDNNCGSVYKSIPKAVKEGKLKESDIDVSLKRLLVGRFMLGELDPDNLSPWSKIPESVLCSKEHKDLAYKMAQQSIVLLKNGPLPMTPFDSLVLRGTETPRGGVASRILPLNAKDVYGKIAVIGPNANDSVMQWGNYNGYPTQTVTILQGIQKKYPQAKYVSGAGWVNNSVPVSHFPEIFTADGQQGMLAEYWNDTNLGQSVGNQTPSPRGGQGGGSTAPVATKRFTTSIYQNNGGATVFAPGVELENFSARYTGILRPKTDGKLKFGVEADDGLRFIVNGDTIDDRFRPAHGVQKRGKEISVKAGKEYNIQIDYLQLSGMAHFQFDITHQSELTQESLLAQLKDAETVIFVGGISPRLEGEEMKVDAKGFKGGDRTDIELPDAQRNLLKAIHDAGKKVIFVNCSGSAIALVPELETCDAILQAWYPGERGGDAVADVLFGDYNPSGKLPVTFYKSVNDLPDFLDYTMTGKSADGKNSGRTYRYFTGEPLFPFGYGLSYTTFEKSKPKVKKSADRCTVTLNVKNSGTMDGDEVVQVYLRNPKDTDGPLKMLRAFERVSLKAGETKTVSIDLTGDQLLWWDKQSNTMQPLAPKAYEVIVQ